MFEQEKMEWLESIRAAKLPEPVVYIYTIPGYDEIYMLSERHIREMRVEDLKAQYKKNELALRERNQPEDKRNIVREEKFADNRFFIIPDDETQTLTISPTEDKYTAIRLNKARAKVLADIILHQIQRW